MKSLLIAIFLATSNFASFAQSSTTPKSYSVPSHYKWNKKRLSVCWKAKVLEEKSTYLALDKPLKKYVQDIKEAVRDQFTLESTGVTFVGWNRCRGLGFLYDVKLSLYAQSSQMDSEIQASATIGADDSDERPNVEIVYKYSKDLGWKKKLSHSDYFKIIALHEFAHIAGLDHQKDGSDPRNPYDIDEDYDRESVMSYKYLNDLILNGFGTSQSKPVLSSGDKNALRCLYVYNDKQKEKRCTNNVVTIH